MFPGAKTVICTCAALNLPVIVANFLSNVPEVRHFIEPEIWTCYAADSTTALVRPARVSTSRKTRFGLLRTSIFFGPQNTGRRTVGFGNHREPVPRAGAIGSQEPEAVL